MSNLSISADTLKKVRTTFRKNTQVPGGIKQKLSHLDNLMALTLGYIHGYGNFAALVKKAPYEFTINQVDPIALVKYEIEHISCGSGVENYLSFYNFLGLSECDCNEFCRDYLIYKLVYSVWNELTNPFWCQQQFEALSELSTDDQDLGHLSSYLFKFQPHYGLLYLGIYNSFTLKDVGLLAKKSEIDNMLEFVEEQGNKPEYYLINHNNDNLFAPLLPDILSSLDFECISTLFINELSKVFEQRRAFNTIAYSAYVFSCEENYYITNFTGRAEATMYLADSSLVLKEGYEFNSVFLTPNEVMEHDVTFGNYGNSKENELFLAERWVHHIKQGSGTSHVEQQNWRDALKRATRSLKENRYISSHTLFKEEIEPYLSAITTNTKVK